MLKASLQSPTSSNQVLLDAFKIQSRDNMYSQLPDYDNSHGFHLSGGMKLVATPTRMMVGFPKTSWLTHKNYLFNAHIRKKLVVEIRENATNDMKDGEFKPEMLSRRVAKRPIPEAFDGLSEMDFSDYAD